MDNLDILAAMWHAAKRREEAAKEDRIKIEEDILALHPAREEGSETFETAGGARITLTGKVTYKADVRQLEQLASGWPEEIYPVRMKVEADDTKLKAIRQHRPDLWQAISDAVTTTPAKTGVSIKFKE